MVGKTQRPAGSRASAPPRPPPAGMLRRPPARVGSSRGRRSPLSPGLARTPGRGEGKVLEGRGAGSCRRGGQSGVAARGLHRPPARRRRRRCCSDFSSPSRQSLARPAPRGSPPSLPASWPPFPPGLRPPETAPGRGRLREPARLSCGALSPKLQPGVLFFF